MAIDQKKYECLEKAHTIINQVGSNLYLLYFVSESGGAQSVTIDIATEHCKNIFTAMSKKTGTRILPLCAATKNAGTGGSNWAECKDNAMFPQGDGKTPYAIWIMTVDCPLMQEDTKGHNQRYTSTIDMSSPPPHKGITAAQHITGVGPKNNATSCLEQSAVMAQAIALRWLVESRPCATKAAIVNSSLLDELCPKKPTAPGPANYPSKKDMEPA